MNDIKKIEHLSNILRKHILNTALAAGASSSHFGGSLSTVEIIATLFGKVMNFNKKIINKTERNRFILSKGHACLAYYAILAELGVFNIEDLKKFEKPNSFLLGHPVINRNKGIEFSNGSLGMGLSLGIGVAIAGKKRKCNFSVYVLMGDGECNEGSIWEAMMAAPNFKLGNLTAIIDKNNYQQTGSNKEIMSVGDLKLKCKSFGWNTFDIDGHNVSELLDCFSNYKKSDQPKMIIANTIKGKGFSFSENNNDWHHAVLTKSQYDIALSELEK